MFKICNLETAILLMLISSIQGNFYKDFITPESILNTTKVNSISSCYFQCWDVEFQCCAVGFLSSEINNNRRSTATCYMIKCNKLEQQGGTIELEILVSNGILNTQGFRIDSISKYSIKDIIPSK